MSNAAVPQAPPFCPNPECAYHRGRNPLWRYKRAGFFLRQASPRRIQRFRCRHCRRHFSSQTFHPTYWLKRPELQTAVFHRLLGCSGYRQIAREFGISPQTVLGQSARLGRHCLLFHQKLLPPGPLSEPTALDSFQSFEYSQDHPVLFHVLAGQGSHFFYGFTDSECRRSGRMTAAQKRRRARIEQALGRPDPRSIEKETAALLRTVAPQPQSLALHTDEHQDYPRALRRVPHLSVTHRTISSRAARTARNPLFPINLLDLLIRHSGANHKRETIAFSKRRQSAIERLWVFLVWRNYVKSFSESKRDASPAMRLGVLERRLTVTEILQKRLFPTRILLAERWKSYYWRYIQTRRIPHAVAHRKTYAF
jgi:hypothetical protein